MPWSWMPSGDSTDISTWSLANDHAFSVDRGAAKGSDQRAPYDVPVKILKGTRGGSQISGEVKTLARACAYNARLMRAVLEHGHIRLDDREIDDALYASIADPDAKRQLDAIRNLTQYSSLASFDASVRRRIDSYRYGTARLSSYVDERLKLYRLLREALATAQAISSKNNKLRTYNVEKDQKLRPATVRDRFSLADNKEVRSDYNISDCINISMHGFVNFARIARNYSYLFDLLDLAICVGRALEDLPYELTIDHIVTYHVVWDGDNPGFESPILQQGWRDAAQQLLARLIKVKDFSRIVDCR